MLAISRFAKQWFGSFQQHRERKAKTCSKSFFSGLRTEFHKQPINTKSACQILPQPRKAHNCSKSSFLGLWTEFQKQPINTKCACQILPQPRKAHNCFKSSFSGLWTEFHQQPINTVRLWQILPQPPKAKNCSKSSFSGLWTDFEKQPINTTCACQILPQPRKAKNCSKSSLSGLWTKFKKQPMNKKTCLSDPTIAPQSKELLQKLVFGAVDGIPQAANDRSYHSAKSTQLLQKLVFGAVDGIPQAANDRSYHSPEKHTIAAKARFRGCGRNSTRSQWQILPQPRKAKNCSKSSFSGLWTEFHKQPMTDPATAPKSKELFQKLVFGAVDGNPQAANDRSCHSPEKQRIAPKARVRGCGRNSTSSQWQILPQPRKAYNCSKSSFSGLLTEFHKQPMTDPTTAPKSTQLLQKLVFGAADGIPQAANDRFYHSPEKHTIAPKARFRGCSQWQILPQPRKVKNCSKSSFSGLWTEIHKQPMTDPATAPKSTQLLQQLVFGAVAGIPQAANDRFYHSPEKHTIAPKACFRGCGRNSTSSQWQILPQPRKAHNCSKSSCSGLRTEFHKQPMTDPATTTTSPFTTTTTSPFTTTTTSPFTVPTTTTTTTSTSTSTTTTTATTTTILVLEVFIVRAGSARYARLRFARVPRVFFCAGSARVVAFKFLQEINILWRILLLPSIIVI